MGPGWNNSIRTSLAAALKKKPTGFTPYAAPTTPPAGTYDPAIDAQGGAAQRGYDYLFGNVADANSRGTAELGFQIQGLARNRDRSLADLLADKTRFGEDQATTGAREGQNYGIATQDLATNYTRMGHQQAGVAAQAGVSAGGTLAAALAKRTANQQHDQSAIDLQHTRFGEDQQTAAQRYNSAYDLNVARVGEDYADNDLGAIGAAKRGEAYQVNDRGTQLQQAGIENVNYQADLGDQRWYQAAQGGYAAPGRGEPGGPPSNEFTDPSGASYRIVVRGTRRYRQNPDGSESFVGTRPAKR